MRKLDPYKSMVPNRLHLRVLREVANVLVRPFSITLEMSLALAKFSTLSPIIVLYPSWDILV